MKALFRLRGAVLVVAVLAGAVLGRGQSITVEMINHVKQTAAGTTAANGSLPYSFEVHIDSNAGTPNMTSWGPSFTIGGGGAGTSTNTNTGTSTFQSNLASTPNKNSNYFFQANFADTTALTTAYPVASGYSVSFTGGGTLTGAASFNAGLNFTSNTYPLTPMVTGLSNGAAWVSNQLQVSTSGTTTLTLNSGSFTDYSGSFGANIGLGLQDQSGTFVSGFSGSNPGSKNTVLGGANNTPASSIMITGSALTAGQTYTLTIQYGLAASSVGSASVGGTTFTGAAIYYAQTQIQILAVPEPSQAAALLGLGAVGLLPLRRRLRVWAKPGE